MPFARSAAIAWASACGFGRAFENPDERTRPVTVTAELPDLLPASCTPWCTLHHGPGLLTAHGRTVAVIEAPHAEVSVLIEQAGEHAPMLALSVDALDP